ncbi:hypothetical protein ACET3Z_032365 [Daucus carota]
MAKQKIAVISVCSILLLAMVVAVTFTSSGENSENSDDTNTKSAMGVTTSQKAIKDICRPADFKETCETKLTAEAGNTTDTKDLIKAAFRVTEKEIREAMQKSPTIQNAAKDPSTADAFKICKEVLGNAIDDLYRSFEKFNISDIEKWDDYAFDLKIWLSGTVAMQETCLEGFKDTEGDSGKKMAELLETSKELTVNALAIIDDLCKAYEKLTTGSKRKLLSVEECVVEGRRELLSNRKYGVEETVYTRRTLQQSLGAPVGAPAAGAPGASGPVAGAPAAGGPAAAGAPATGASGPAAGASGPAAGAPAAGAPATGASGPAVGAPAAGAPAGAPVAGAPAGASGPASGGTASPFGSPTGAPAGAPSSIHSPTGAPEVVPVVAAPPAPPPDLTQPNAVVAQDGSGTFKTIDAALQAMPPGNTKRYVIHVKAGVYQEYIRINNTQTNVVLVGDGPTQTKITGNKSVILDHLKTYHTATVGVDGFGFVARDIGFENTAGTGGEQAVALRVSSDQAAFYNCKIDGFQDTLYAHVHRQYYRDCTISGTIDFIFGDAAALFQNCTLVVRKPGVNQANMVTAQGRKFDYEPTGFVLQNCKFTGEPDYLAAAATFKSYLGRPWKDYAKTMVLYSNIESVIDPTGWQPWPPNLYIDTCWYAEFGNTGPAAATTSRVTWQGIKHVAKEEAETYVPGKFLRGDDWISATGVPYTSGVMPAA